MQPSPHSLKEQEGEEEGPLPMPLVMGVGKLLAWTSFLPMPLFSHFSKLIPQSELEQGEMQGGHGRGSRLVGLGSTKCIIWAFPGGTSAKAPTCQCSRSKRRGFGPWVEKTPWRSEWQPTLIFFPGENPMDRGAWRTIVHGVAQSWTRLRRLSTNV